MVDMSVAPPSCVLIKVDNNCLRNVRLTLRSNAAHGHSTICSAEESGCKVEDVEMAETGILSQFLFHTLFGMQRMRKLVLSVVPDSSATLLMPALSPVTLCCEHRGGVSKTACMVHFETTSDENGQINLAIVDGPVVKLVGSHNAVVRLQHELDLDSAPSNVVDFFQNLLTS